MLETANREPGRNETSPTGRKNKTGTGSCSKTNVESTNGKPEMEKVVEAFSKAEEEAVNDKTEREAFSTAED
jgi:hypothetical protein